MAHLSHSNMPHSVGSQISASDEVAHSTDRSRTAHFDVESQAFPDLHEENAEDQSSESIELKNPKRADTTVSRTSTNSMRRRGRTNTVNTLYDHGAMGTTSGWTPGEEPGLDTSNPAAPYKRGSSEGSDTGYPDKLHQLCEITVVDYS